MGAGDEADVRRHGGRWHRSSPTSALWLGVTLLFTSWSRSSLWTYLWANVDGTNVAPGVLARCEGVAGGRRVGNAIAKRVKLCFC